jgi:hypothetical protein
MKGGITMKSIAKQFENIFTAVAFAEEGEFEMAKHILADFHAQRDKHSHFHENRLEKLQPLRADK